MNPPGLLDRTPATHAAGDPLLALCSAALEALPHAVGVFAPGGDVLRANAAFRALLDAAGAAGVRTLAEVAGLDGHVLQAAIERALRGERLGPLCVPFGRTAPRLMDVTLIPLALPDGEMGLALSLVPAAVVDTHAPNGAQTGVVQANGAHVAGVHAGAAADGVPTDTPADAPTLSPAELDALFAEQARRARERRLAAVGQLAAGVMHDVNNALNPIVAAAHLLQLNADKPDAVRDYARRIERAAETAASTAARVGRFIRQEPLADGTNHLIDLGTLAEEVVEMTRSLWTERAGGGAVRLVFERADGVQVRGSAGELREALLNLVWNALDAMQGGGVLGVRVTHVAHVASIEVSDTGAGMSSEVRERAFEPFFTTKGVRGTGLGLSEVWGVVRRHRGHAEIHSEAGVGTTVRLDFPRPDIVRRVSGEMLVVGSVRVVRRVLLVEDQEDGRQLMHAMLATEGHHVESVGTLAEARQRLASGDRYDVLVTDLGLPDGSGLDLVREVRVRWPSLRVGVVTGWEPHELRESLPAHFTLRKPVRPPELLACVGTDA